VSVVPALRYPPPDDIPPPDPNVPPPLLPAFRLPGDGYVLAETDDGWRDEEHTAFAGSSADRPTKSDPILSFLLDSSGHGWAVGGWSGEADPAGRGSPGGGGARQGGRRGGARQAAGPRARAPVSGCRLPASTDTATRPRRPARASRASTSRTGSL